MPKSTQLSDYLRESAFICGSFFLLFGADIIAWVFATIALPEKPAVASLSPCRKSRFTNRTTNFSRVEIESLVPDFTYRLIQLAEMPFDAIRGTPAGILTLRVMKAERLEKLLEDYVWDEALFLRVPREIIELLFRYILDADVDKAAFDRKVMTVTNPEIQNTAMTLAQQYRQEGRQEGRILAQQRAVIEALEIRFEQVPAGLQEEIAHIHDPLRLAALLRAAIQAASLEEFSRSL